MPRRSIATAQQRSCAAACKCAPGGGEAGSEEGYSERPGDGRPVREPNPWFFLERAYPLGRIPRDDLAALRKPRSVASARRSPPAGRPAAPGSSGGRPTSAGASPTWRSTRSTPNVAFAGTAEGGVLRTTTADSTGPRSSTTGRRSPIGAVALDPATPPSSTPAPDEVNPGGGSVAYGGAGIFRSTDRGDTWTSARPRERAAPSGGSASIRRDRQPDLRRRHGRPLGEGARPRPLPHAPTVAPSWQKSPLRERLHRRASTWSCGPTSRGTLFAATWERIRTPERLPTTAGSPAASTSRPTAATPGRLVGGGLPTPSTNLRPDRALALQRPARRDVRRLRRPHRLLRRPLPQRPTAATSWTRTTDGALCRRLPRYGWWFGNCRTPPHRPEPGLRARARLLPDAPTAALAGPRPAAACTSITTPSSSVRAPAP